MGVVGRAEVLVGNVSVDLRSRNIAVTEQGLHRTRIRAVLQQVSRKTVPQRMRGNVIDADTFGVILDREPGKLPCQWLATA